ncbi:UNVERIFIED_CONTAM: hypothetical protein HDU68_011836, partial [Siphonaria sp. JEL0065]
GPGQTVYIPAIDQSKAPAVFAYIPDDGSATYLIDTQTNTTTTLSGFGTSGPMFRYSATSSNIVQLDTKSGNLKVLAVSGGSVSSGTGLASLPVVAPTKTPSSTSQTGASSTNGTTQIANGATTVAATAKNSGGDGLNYLCILSKTMKVSSAATSIQAIGCTVNDMSQNLYVFGAPYGDINLGAASSDWISATAPTTPDLLTNIANRPAFDTANPICSYAPYLNYITVLNGDSSKGLSALHVFDVVAKSWTIVPLTGADLPNGSDIAATLDHDTNVIYAFSNGYIYRLGDADKSNLSQLASNPGLSIPWLAKPVINSQPFDATGYKPVFGQGTNHLHFLGAPGLADGQAWIFVVHYAWWQPEPQTFGSFKAGPGQTVYIPAIDQSKAPAVFAYIPDDGSATYLIDTKTNTTTTLTGFGKSGPTYRYSATSTNIVQLDTASGNLALIPVAGGNVASGTGLSLLPTATGIKKPSGTGVATVTSKSAGFVAGVSGFFVAAASALLL